MTGVTDHQGFALTYCHQSNPSLSCAAIPPLQICQFANVVDFDVLARAAEFAFVGFEALEQFRARKLRWRGWLVIEDGPRLAFQR